MLPLLRPPAKFQSLSGLIISSAHKTAHGICFLLLVLHYKCFLSILACDLYHFPDVWEEVEVLYPTKWKQILSFDGSSSRSPALHKPQGVGGRREGKQYLKPTPVSIEEWQSKNPMDIDGKNTGKIQGKENSIWDF